MYTSRATTPLTLLHLDLWPPSPTPSTSGARYFLLIVDDFSFYSWLYSLSSKDQEQLNLKIKCLQSNNGSKFFLFSKCLVSNGIDNRFSCPYTPTQIGHVERKISISLKQEFPSFQLHLYLYPIGFMSFTQLLILSTGCPLPLSEINSPSLTSFTKFKMMAC